MPLFGRPQVQVSMKFDGQSSVEVHPHTNLEDLKTVTSISLFIRVDPDKDPIEDRFILYLGDRNVRNPGEKGETNAYQGECKVVAAKCIQMGAVTSS